MTNQTNGRIRALTAIIGLGLVSGMLLSIPLWFGPRDFPRAPLISSLPDLPAVETVAIVLLLSSLIAAIATQRRIAFAIAIASLAILALLDQMRWQPWVYQYLLMLLPFAWQTHRLKSNPDAVIALQQILIGAVYFWSGAQKFHAGFLRVYETSLMKPILDAMEPGALRSVVIASGYTIPPIEIAIGIALLLKRTRRPAIFAAMATHIIILIMLGPLKGSISNSVVWPWNFAMMGFVFCLFWKTGIGPQSLFKTASWRHPSCLLIFTLMGPAPVLYHFDLWDRYLSFNLYSGRGLRARIKVEQPTIPLLPTAWQAQLVDTLAPDGHKILSLNRWSERELNVPLVSEWRVLRALSAKINAHEVPEYPFIYYIDHPNTPEIPGRFFPSSQIGDMRP